MSSFERMDFRSFTGGWEFMTMDIVSQPIKERILIVDDELILLNLLYRMIQGFGYQCLKCDDGIAAVEILKTEPVDVLLTDMVMPKMNGMELILHCRRNYLETDIIAMTGFGRRYSYTDVIKAGCVDFIEKPIESDELQAKLQRVIREQLMRRELRNEIDERKKAEKELQDYQQDLEKIIRERTRELSQANSQLSAKVDEHKRAEEEVRAYAEKIKFFAYSVSHDLKTPALAINGLATLLEKKYLDGKSDRTVDICRRLSVSSKQLMELVDNINLYIKAKESPVSLEEISVEELFTSLRQEYNDALAARDIVWVQETHQPTVRADKLALTRVFRNFVDNALQYGGCELSTIHLKCSHSGTLHMFSVSDDGVGLVENEKESIFELFSRSKESVGKEGTGMGLAIVREIAEKHNGYAWAESTEEAGTTFFFTIDGTL